MERSPLRAWGALHPGSRCVRLLVASGAFALMLARLADSRLDSFFATLAPPFAFTLPFACHRLSISPQSMGTVFSNLAPDSRWIPDTVAVGRPRPEPFST